jgi:hypothetical protein
MKETDVKGELVVAAHPLLAQGGYRYLGGASPEATAAHSRTQEC